MASQERPWDLSLGISDESLMKYLILLKFSGNLQGLWNSFAGNDSLLFVTSGGYVILSILRAPWRKCEHIFNELTICYVTLLSLFRTSSFRCFSFCGQYFMCFDYFSLLNRAIKHRLRLCIFGLKFQSIWQHRK